MIHPMLVEYLANQHQQDLLKEAEQERLVRAARAGERRSWQHASRPLYLAWRALYRSLTGRAHKDVQAGTGPISTEAARAGAR